MMEYKHINAKFTDFEPDTGIFSGFASTFHTGDDLDGDVVVKGAFTESLKSGSQVLMCWMHNLEHVLGLWLNIQESNEGLEVKGKLTLEVNKAREAYYLLRDGAISGLSIGYFVNPGGSYVKDGTRFLTSLTLKEISIVSLPANIYATVTDVKSVTAYQSLPLADETTGWDGSAARGRVKKWATTGDALDYKKYRKAFLYVDDAAPDELGSYKFPIADVIKGDLKVVPRAIFAAAADIGKAKGISDSEIAGMKTHLGRYYKKLGRTSPFSGEGDKSHDATREEKTMDPVTLPADFNKTLESRKAREVHLQNRRDIEMAHKDNMEAIYGTPVTLDQKKAMVDTGMDQYCAARKSWHHKDMDMADSGDYGEMSFDPWVIGYGTKGEVDSREIKAIAGPLHMVSGTSAIKEFTALQFATKAGKTISAATQAKLDAVATKFQSGCDMHQKALNIVADGITDLKSIVPVASDNDGDETVPNPVAPGVSTNAADTGEEVVSKAIVFTDFRTKMKSLLTA